MNKFLRGGRGLAEGQSRVRLLADDKVTKLSRYEIGTGAHDRDLSDRPKEQSKYVLECERFNSVEPFGGLHYGRNDGGRVRQMLLIIFCVLFSVPDLLGTGALAQSQHRAASRINFGDRASLVSPAFGQEAEGLNKIVPLKIGDTIPDSLWHYKMPLYKGVDIIDSLSLSDFSKDEKVLIIDFWPYWCSPCIKSVLQLDSLTKAKQYQNITFISINVIDLEQRYLKFVNQSGFNVPTLYDFSFLVNRLLTRYRGYYGVLMLKGNKVMGAPDVRTLTEDNLDKIENGKWSENTVVYWPELHRFEFAQDFGKGGKP